MPIETITGEPPEKYDYCIDELGSAAEFQQKVLELQKPLILDCYADWCKPCKQLTPVLENLTRQYAGKFHLLKVNIDQNQAVAQALNVKSIPALFLFHKGQVLDSMTGIDIDKLEVMVSTALKLDDESRDPAPLVKILSEA